jgi:polyisoprenoid-binding protein YceI
MATYQIDTAHTGAYFKIRHMMIANVGGRFSNVSGTINFDPSNLAASSIDATIDSTSIATGQPPRDAHLKGPDFFDVEKHPTITFKSKKITADGSGYKATGDFTFRGVTKEVTFNVDAVSPEMKDPWGSQRRGTSATATIDRRDFGLVFNAPVDGGVMLGDDVKITLDVEMTRKE